MPNPSTLAMEEEEEKEIQEDARYRAKPIFGTNFSKPLVSLLEEAREQLVRTRGLLYDLGQGYPVLEQRMADVQGLLTCGLVYLYHLKEGLKGQEWAEKAPPPHLVLKEGGGPPMCSDVSADFHCELHHDHLGPHLKVLKDGRVATWHTCISITNSKGL